MLLCIRLPNFVQIGAHIAKIMTSCRFFKLTAAAAEYYFRFRICWCHCLSFLAKCSLHMRISPIYNRSKMWHCGLNPSPELLKSGKLWPHAAVTVEIFDSIICRRWCCSAVWFSLKCWVLLWLMGRSVCPTGWFIVVVRHVIRRSLSSGQCQCQSSIYIAHHRECI